MDYSIYLTEEYLYELYQNHDIEYLKNIDKENFQKVYNVLINYKLDYIEDIILKYLDIFTLDYKIVEEKLNKLIKVLGNDYQNIISENLSYLEYIVRN